MRLADGWKLGGQKLGGEPGKETREMGGTPGREMRAKLASFVFWLPAAPNFMASMMQSTPPDSMIKAFTVVSCARLMIAAQPSFCTPW